MFQINSLTINRAERRSIPSVSSLEVKKIACILYYSSIIHSMQNKLQSSIVFYRYRCVFVLSVCCVSVVPGHMINERLCSVLRKQVGFEFLISCDSGPGFLSWGAQLREKSCFQYVSYGEIIRPPLGFRRAPMDHPESDH